MEISVSNLCAILQRPRLTSTLTQGEWSALVALARKTNLLGTLAEKLREVGVASGGNGDRHLTGARRLSDRQRCSVRWEIQAIHEALGGLGIPVVLLKGAAYVMGGYANARGRLFGDIDILVPADRLADVEIQLMINGWAPIVSTEYDERYYRTWMHELPPMAHVRRGTVLDVHHTILPPTARLKPVASRIIERSLPLAGLHGLRVPCPEDLIIHSIVHLVHEGSVDNGLRDLSDIWQILERQIGNQHFITRLQDYAAEHGTSAPVSMGLRLVQRFFDVRLPHALVGAADSGHPRFGYGAICESLYASAIAAGSSRLRLALARQAIYVRAHWLRMPPLLLTRHLGRKLLLRFRDVNGREPPSHIR